LASKAQKAEVEVVRARAKLENKGFLAKAPAEVVAEEQKRLASAEALLADAQAQYRERVGGELPLFQGKRP
jgi:valyl-tRNA synthetase